MTNNMPQNILIIGATGVIGAPITEAIVNAEPSFGRIAMLTSSATVANKTSIINHLRASGVEILTGDLSNEQDVKKAYNGARTHPPSCCLLPSSLLTPTNPRHRHRNLLRWPQRHPKPNLPHPVGLRDQCHSLLPLRIRHRHRI